MSAHPPYPFSTNTHPHTHTFSSKLHGNSKNIQKQNKKRNVRSGTLAPPTNGHHYPNGKIYFAHWIPEWLDLNFMVPLIATVIVVAVGILVICVALSRRRMDDPRCGPKDVYCRFFLQLSSVLQYTKGNIKKISGKCCATTLKKTNAFFTQRFFSLVIIVF